MSERPTTAVHGAEGRPVSAPLVSVRDLRVSFGGRAVVHGIDLDIHAGEKLALVGESGSGKSVTALSLLQLVPGGQATGFAHVSGFKSLSDGDCLLSISERMMQRVRGEDIAVIFQEPMTALNPVMTVGRQIAEVIELKQAAGRTQAWSQAVALLERTGISEAARRAAQYPHQLSGGQRQRAMIAMALACKPKLLLADEPTTALDVTVRGQILGLLDQLQREEGMAVLLITHDLNLVRRFADRVLVMAEGRLVESGPVDQVLTQPQQAYTRQLVNSRPVRHLRPVPAQAPELLGADQLGVVYAVPRPGWTGWWRSGQFVALQGASLALKAGQTVAVVGESGSGKSTLAQAVLGLLPSTGELKIAGRTWSGRLVQDRSLRQTIQVVFQDPFSSLSPRMTVEELVGEGLRVHQPQASAADRQAQVLRTLALVGLDEARFPGLLQRYPHEFSGGQRQRLAIARALVVQPRILVLDEPTSALDVSIQQQVLALLQSLQREQGLSYLLITHDMAVVAAMAHEVLVLKSGQVVEAGPVDQVLHTPRHAYTQQLVAAI